ncbi:MAG: DNA/RNA non-specific endonuclease [Lachnospiraceae bacterium]|nr:DNA/RNA non-specific endonuclease [Lachnospiraceae bacterium]
MKKSKLQIALAALISSITLTLCACGQFVISIDADASQTSVFNNQSERAPQLSNQVFTLAEIPPYMDQPYITVNDNIPYFSEEDFTVTSYESYSDLDDLGRCQAAIASVGLDLMPTEERGSIGHVKPSGWQSAKYDIVDGHYLYNRCHLIGYQLSGENANAKNLITGTRYLNMEGMLPFENMVADYVKESGNHVLYRVTPIYENTNLLASGVLMEAQSVEDMGESILFCVYAYNVQPGIIIDYATGDSSLDTGTANTQNPQAITYILNTGSQKFHYPHCSSINQIKDANKEEYTGSREDLISQGYTPCKNCNP